MAGVSRGALLHHFPNKHALVVGVLTYVNEFTFAQSTRRAKLARTSGDPIEEIIKDAQEFNAAVAKMGVVATPCRVRPHLSPELPLSHGWERGAAAAAG